MARPKASRLVEYEGPMFQTDPDKRIRENIRAMLDDLAAWGEADVRSQLAPHSRTVPPAVMGYTKSTKSGKQWALSAAVNLVTTDKNRAEAIGLQARVHGRAQGNRGTTRGLEATTGAFRRTRSAMSRARAVLAANITKGLEQ